MFQALMKLSLELEPCWAIQKECSRQMRMAVHVVVSNYKYKRKSRINQTNERMQRRHLCNWEYMSEENWKGWGMVLQWIEHPQDFEHSPPTKCAPVNRVGQKEHVGEERYKLSKISQWHVSNSNWAQEVHSNSLPGWDFMVAYQQFKSSPGGAQQLTSWMGFHGGMSAIQIKPRRHTGTHLLDGISWWHVSNSNQAQEGHTATHVLDGIS